MHPEVLNELDLDLLDKIKKMFIAGSTVEEMLNLLELHEFNQRLYKYYLEAACGRRLDGSVYLLNWKKENTKTRLEILGYLEAHLQEIRCESR